MRVWRKMTALVLAAAVTVGMPLVVSAKNAVIDGNTPEEITNRVTTVSGEIVEPSVITDFHAPVLAALVPVTPKNVFDAVTGANISHYDDAATHVYVVNNYGYGPLAKSALDNARQAVGAKADATFTMNLLLFEGKVYKPRESTVMDMEFKLQIPKYLRADKRDYAVLRLNSDGTVSYLTDLDTDPGTLTFRTNYFGTYSVYCLAYGKSGCFDAYKPVVDLQPVDQETLAVWASMGIPTDPETLAVLGYQAVPAR